MLRSASGILGTVEVGNGFPRDGTDGEWKIAGRDAILTMKDGIMKLATAESDETPPRRQRHRAGFHRTARCARPLATRRGASDQRARLRAGRAVDRSSARARRVTINEARRPWNGATKWRW